MHSKNKLPKTGAHQHGLTLIELLVAISILGIVAVMGWRGLDSIIRSRTALNNQLEQTRGMQLAFAQLQSDCAHLADNTLLPGRPPLNALADKLTLIRSVNKEGQPTRLQVVSYRVRDSILTRQESTATRDLQEIDQDWKTALSNSAPSTAIKLQNDVITMTFRVWLKGSGAWQPGMDEIVLVNLNTGVSPQGLEVVLEQKNQTFGLVKLFLLGPV